MNSELIATVFTYGGQVISALLKNRAPKRTEPPAYPLVEEPEVVEELHLSGGEMVEIPIDKEGKAVAEEASGIKAGCVPCAIGHISTCSGELAEGMRFARSDGMASNEVIDRIGHCLEELNVMEREDLSAQKIASLPQWEKELAIKALNVSREMRHTLEGMSASSTVNDLEAVAAWAQESRQEIVRGWFKQKLTKMPGKEKDNLAKEAVAKLEEGSEL